LSFTTLELDQRGRPPSDGRGPWVMWDANRSDPGDKRHGLAGTDARVGFKDDAEFDFRHRGTLPSGSVLEFPKLLFRRGRGPYPEADIWPPLSDAPHALTDGRDRPPTEIRGPANAINSLPTPGIGP
jgi:hypothetical protein